MHARNPLRFGVSIDPTAAGFAANLELAEAADGLGLDLLTGQDHPYHARHLDAWTHLAVLAARSERIHVMPNVANLPLRGAQMLAKAAASLAIMTEGRVVLGLGAGAMWDPIAAYGGPRRSPGEAVDALEEAIDVIRLLWDADQRGRYDGRFYRLEGARPGPLPAETVPIWIGAYGPRMLALTGRAADGWTPSLQFAGPERIPEMQERIDEEAADADRDPASIRRSYNVTGRITDQPPRNTEEGQLALDVAGWVDTLAGFVAELGFDTLVFWPPGEQLVDQARRFAEQVIPAVRDAVGEDR